MLGGSGLEPSINAIKSVPEIVRKSVASLDVGTLEAWKSIFLTKHSNMTHCSIDSDMLAWAHYGTPCSPMAGGGPLSRRISSLEVIDLKNIANFADDLQTLKASVVTIWGPDGDEHGVNRLVKSLQELYPDVYGYKREEWVDFVSGVDGAMRYRHRATQLPVYVMLDLKATERRGSISVTTPPSNDQGTAGR
eukprot:GHVU01093962.1.p1 GENE.GHVU01093962.1~~GHVU01093962.1.p1  ORF type:complete len:192 (+),score=8.87 GHVU01093962.1:1338-1913(+)